MVCFLLSRPFFHPVPHPAMGLCLLGKFFCKDAFIVIFFKDVSLSFFVALHSGGMLLESSAASDIT